MREKRATAEVERRDVADAEQTWRVGGRVAVGPVSRLLASGLTVLAFLLGQLAFATGIPHLGQVTTSLFVHFGPGVAFCLLLKPLDRYIFALLTLTVGPAIGIILSMAAALPGLNPTVVWPILATAVLAVVASCATGDLLDLRRRTTADPAREEPTGGPVELSPRTRARDLLRDSRVVSSGVSLLGFGIAVIAGALHFGIPGPGGAAVNAGPAWFLGALLTLAGFGLAWRLRTSLLVPVLCLTTIVVATQAAMYGEPTVVVSAKHIGIVDFLVETHKLLLGTDIYQAWSGLFAVSALDAHAAHIVDLFAFASWWPVGGSIIEILAVRTLAECFLDYRRAWLAALLVGLGGSLNTTFFAPQVVGFAMAFVMVAMFAAPRGRLLAATPALRYSAAGILSVAMAVTHQISPYMTFLAMAALVVFRVIRPWWTPLIPLLPAVAWALFNRDVLSRFVDLSALGAVLTNLSPPEHSSGTLPLAFANRLTFGLPAVALVVIGLVALYKLWSVRGRVMWGLAFATASPVVLMAGTAYGNEGIFRVALFALPWLAIMACVPGLRQTRLVLPGWAGPVAVGLLTVCYVIGSTGMDQARVIRADDVSMVAYVEDTSPPGSLVLCMGTDLTIPYDSTLRYQDTDFVARSRLYETSQDPYPKTTGAAYDARADLTDLTTRFRELGGKKHYAVVADSIGVYDQAYGNQREADSEKLAAAVADSPLWRRVFASGDSIVYELRKEPTS